MRRKDLIKADNSFESSYRVLVMVVKKSTRNDNNEERKKRGKEAERLAYINYPDVHSHIFTRDMLCTINIFQPPPTKFTQYKIKGFLYIGRVPIKKSGEEKCE